MNLSRLRELAQAGKDGALRPEEAKELFEALPEVLDRVAPSEPQIVAEACRAENSEDWNERLDGLDRGDCYNIGYRDGMRRKWRDAR